MSLECVNTNCKPTDPEYYCVDCGCKVFLKSDASCRATGIPTYCSRCGNALVLFDKEIIDRAVSNALATPIGQTIDFEKAFGFDKEQ